MDESRRKAVAHTMRTFAQMTGERSKNWDNLEAILVTCLLGYEEELARPTLKHEDRGHCPVCGTSPCMKSLPRGTHQRF